MGRRLTTASIAVLAFCSGTAVSFLTLPLWVTAFINLAKESGRNDWLGFYGAIIGSVITAAVAAMAIYFAWRAVTKQLRIGLVSREEDRIEVELPGLRQAGDLLRSCALEFLPDPQQVLEQMKAKNLIVEGSFEINDLKILLPDVGERSLKPIFSILNRVALHCERFLRDRSYLDQLEREMVNDLITFPPHIIEQRKRMRSFQYTQIVNHHEMLKYLLGELRAVSKGVDLRIQRLTDRQISFRNEIEKFFDPA